jgi:creatinine amidohydrolase
MKAAEVSYVALRRAAPESVAVVPMGSVEAHGPHLPCGTDCMLIEAILDRAVAAAGEAGRVVVFPTVAYSVVEWARPLGSAGVSCRTLLAALVETFRDIHGLGFRRIIAVHGHAGLQVANVAFWQLWSEGTRALFADVHPYEMAAESAERLAGEPLTHAGAAETAMMLAAHPDRVDTARRVDGPADLWGEAFPFATLRRPGVYCIPSIEALPDGVEGRPTAANAELGEKLLALYASALAEVLVDLVSSEVPEMLLRPFRRGKQL